MFYTSDKLVTTPQKQAGVDGSKSIFDTENRIKFAGAATPTPVNSPIDATNEYGFKQSPGGTPITARKLHHDSVTMHQLSSITRGAETAASHKRNLKTLGLSTPILFT